MEIIEVNQTKIPLNYQNGKIYTLRSHNTDKYYIGSTTQSLAKRLSMHREQYKSHKRGVKKQFISSYDILKHDDCYIELMELFPCNSKIELQKREGELIRQHKANAVNINIAGRTIPEYYEDNKEKIGETSKKFREANKDYHKNWHKEHADYNKTYYEKHKQEKLRTLMICGCGGKYSSYSKSLHLTRKKHINWLQNEPKKEPVEIVAQ